MNFLGGEGLPKICPKSVSRKQPELHKRLLVQYTTAMAAIINHQSSCTWPDVQSKNTSKLSTSEGGEEVPKICLKRVRPTQPELQTRLLVQYSIAMADIVNQLNINVDNERLHAWYQ